MQLLYHEVRLTPPQNKKVISLVLNLVLFSTLSSTHCVVLVEISFEDGNIWNRVPAHCTGDSSFSGGVQLAWGTH